MIAYSTKTHKTIEPLPHQQRILEELKMFNKALVHIPSGAGKTHTSAFDVRNRKPKTFLYISHRNEINTQAIKIFKEICGIEDLNIGIINQNSKQFDKPFLFATIQTISRTRNIKKLQKDIEYVVIDEFHHAAAKSYRKIIKYLQPKILLGLTATPDRMDAQDVRQLLDNNVVGNIDIIEGIKNKILIPFHYRAYKDNVDYSQIQYQNYNYKENDLDKVLLIPERDKKVIETYKEIIEPDNRQTIGFCATIKHVKRMVEKFKEAGINCEGITYKDKIGKRQRTIEKFRNGKITVLFTRDILNEGVDFPECEALMFLRPTMSETIFLQQLGRGLRKKRGKKPVIVLDYISNYHNAYKIKAYLSKIIGKRPNVIEKGKNYKPLYNLSLPYYEMESEVIEMMELQEKMFRNSRHYTDQELIDNYFYVMKILEGEQPVQLDLADPKLSKIPIIAYLKRFGSWNNFLTFINQPIKHTKYHNILGKKIKSKTQLLKILKKLINDAKKDTWGENYDKKKLLPFLDFKKYWQYKILKNPMKQRRKETFPLKYLLKSYGINNYFQLLESLNEKRTLNRICKNCSKRYRIKNYFNQIYCGKSCMRSYNNQIKYRQLKEKRINARIAKQQQSKNNNGHKTRFVQN